MPRGRPKKETAVKAITCEKVVKQKKLPPSHGQVGEIKEKKAAPTKKRSRKKKNQELLLKPEDILDYIDRNYPKLQINKIRNSVIEGLKNRDQNVEQTYVLDEVLVSGETYYCDPDGNILNNDAHICGYVIDSNADTSSDSDEVEQKSYRKGKTQDKRTVRVQMFYAESDDRTFKQVMNDFNE